MDIILKNGYYFEKKVLTLLTCLSLSVVLSPLLG
jgi:hypothetical protein